MAEIKIAPFSYSGAPKGYECGVCHAFGVRLWRLHNTFMDYQKLYCRPCALADQKKHIENVDEAFRKLGMDSPETDQIGMLMPAVPTENGESFWGYTSVPQPGVDWWQRLPVNSEPLQMSHAPVSH